MRRQHSWGARANPPSAYASRVRMVTITIIGLLLMTTSVQGMPGDDDDAGRSSWANDIRGITVFRAVDREVQPNIMNVHVGRPLWRQLRFKIVRGRTPLAGPVTDSMQRHILVQRVSGMQQEMEVRKLHTCEN